ncbi:hypothetical protein B0H34DRAFT_684636 [Crassisporium funariophilum]|nr:hypothetical protein B0H34DRAFT_684636 [Crassisporium funariophilum]
MSEFQPSQSFHNAASYTSSASSLAQVSNAVKLELYGLYKYLTLSRTPSTPRPSIFDMTGRAKWDAWIATGKKYDQPQDAEKRYLDIARNLGWTETSEVPLKRSPELATDEDSLDDDTSSHSTSGAGSSGMGLTVSSIAPPPMVTDNSLHGLAISNDNAGLIALLDQRPETDLNARDEYGYAPIHLACDRGNTDIVKSLLVRGADRHIKDPDDFSPLELAQEAGHSEIAHILSSVID